jgi:cytochrome c5
MNGAGTCGGGLARLTRFERATPAFGGLYSIQLSYRRFAGTASVLPIRGTNAARVLVQNTAMAMKPGGFFSPSLVGILVAAVPIAIVCASVDQRHEKTGSPEAMGRDATIERLAPVSFVAATPGQSARSTHFKGGHAVYDETCSACHETGIAGAPRIGDKAAWAPRISKGFPTLVGHAVKGFQGKDGIMPPKGGGDWDNVEVARAVAWMTGRAGGSFAEPDVSPVR